MAYTVEQKAVAIAVVRRYDNLVTAAAIDEIRQLLTLPNLTTQTVRNWVKEVQPTQNDDTSNLAQILPQKKSKNPVTEKDVEAANEALDDVFERTARVYLEHANKPDVIKDTKGPQAVTAAAIAFDKMRIGRGLPTEIIGVVTGLVEDAQRKGFDPYKLLSDLRGAINADDATALH